MGLCEDIPESPDTELSAALRAFLRVEAFVVTGDGKARAAQTPIQQELTNVRREVHPAGWLERQSIQKHGCKCVMDLPAQCFQR
jgi:hypothetical protein